MCGIRGIGCPDQLHAAHAGCGCGDGMRAMPLVGWGDRWNMKH